MKKIILTALSATVVLIASAQDTKQVKKQIEKNDWAGARTTIDQVVTNDKYSKYWESWYIKGKVYSHFATDSTLKGTVPNAIPTALDAFKMAYQLDSTQTNVFASLDKYLPITDLYNTSFNAAYKQFGAEQFGPAFEGFKQTDSVGRFLYARKLGVTELDTVVTYYLGFTAMKLDKKEDATFFLKKLADAKVNGTGYELAYRWLTYYYSDKQDWAHAKKYADLGKSLYPKDSYFDDVSLDMLKAEGKDDELVKKYEELLTADPNNYERQYNYGNTLFNNVYGVDKKPANFDEQVTKLEAAFTKAIEIEPTRPEAYLALGKSHFNRAVDINDQVKLIKGKAPADEAKKKDLQSKAEAQIKEAINPLEKVFNTYESKDKLKLTEKSNYKTATNLLIDCYKYINDITKSKFYEDKYNKADTK